MKTSKIIEERMQMITSLQTAIIEAGGCLKSWEELKVLTLEELVEILAPNNIRFVHQTIKE